MGLSVEQRLQKECSQESSLDRLLILIDFFVHSSLYQVFELNFTSGLYSPFIELQPGQTH